MSEFTKRCVSVLILIGMCCVQGCDSKTDNSSPPMPFNLTTPSDGALRQALTPTLNWNDSSGEQNYTLEIAVDSAFNSILHGVSLLKNTVSYNVSSGVGLQTNKQYFWRVTATNSDGSVSAGPFSFYTIFVADAISLSYSTLCAEEDNVNVAIIGAIRSFLIEVTHPIYSITNFTCNPNFSNCPSGGTTYSFSPPGVFKLYDDTVTVVEAIREGQWWLPEGMQASVDSGAPLNDIHYIRIYRRIAGTSQYPQILVMYSDSNLRLIPQPPVGYSFVCFGSSVIVGPAVMATRPFAQISSIKYVSTSKTLEITYKAGGYSSISIEKADRTITRLRVLVNYPTTNPFVTFRSMWISDGNSDVAYCQWKNNLGISYDHPIMSFQGGSGSEWFFHRKTSSIHNDSSPDIKIVLLK